MSRQIGPDGLNLLINNAGINRPAAPAYMLATRKQDMMEVYETNVAGPFITTKVGFSDKFLDVFGSIGMACRGQ